MDQASSPARTVADRPGALGQALRALRQRRELTLAQVAAGTGISKSFLSLVEAGKSDITIGRLMRLVRFYGISVTDLIPGEAGSSPAVVRAGSARSIASPAEGIEDLLLAPDTRRTMLPILAIFAVGGKNVEPAQHYGEEFLHILEGSILVRLEGSDPIELNEGDSLYFEADRPHAYENFGDKPARVLFVVTPPHF